MRWCLKLGILAVIMQSLFVLYSALAVFGVGVTIIDLFGVFEHAGGSGHDGGDSGHDGGDSGHDGGDSVHDGGDSVHDGGNSGHDSGDSGHDSGDSGHDGDDSGHDGDDSGHDHVHMLPSHDTTHHHGSYIASADSATRFVARTIGVLRTGVYFSLGAGPTGLFAVLTGVAPGESLAWSAGAGVFIAILARALRSFIRKDLDSSIAPQEFIMDKATIIVSVTPGAMGKAVVRRYGTEHEVFVRAKDVHAAFTRGDTVRIIDFDDDCYWIELA